MINQKQKSYKLFTWVLMITGFLVAFYLHLVVIAGTCLACNLSIDYFINDKSGLIVLLLIYTILIITLPQNLKTILFHIKRISRNHLLRVYIISLISLFFAGTLVLTSTLLFGPPLLLIVLISSFFGLNPVMMSHSFKQEDFYRQRTSDIESLISRYIKDKQIVNLSGQWGSGKTHFLKSFYNKLRKNRKYIPIYLALDNIDTTEKLIESFRTKVSDEIYSISGIKLDLDLGAYLGMFTAIGLPSFERLISNLLPNSGSSFIESISNIDSLKNRTFVILIDDLDRVITFQEIKFILELIQHLSELNSYFKVIFASNNDTILHPLIGYEILSNTGGLELDKSGLSDTISDGFNSISNALGTVASAAQRERNKFGGSIPPSSTHVFSQTSNMPEEAKALGSSYMDKYRDIEIRLPKLTDKALTEKLFQQLQITIRHPKISRRAAKIFEEKPIPFNGDFRLMKRLLFYVDSVSQEAIINERLQLSDTVVFFWEIMTNTTFLTSLRNQKVEYQNSGESKVTIMVDNYSYLKLSDRLQSHDITGALKNKKNLKVYIEELMHVGTKDSETSSTKGKAKTSPPQSITRGL